MALKTLVEFATTRLGLARIPTLVTESMLDSVTSLPITGLGLAYAGSVCVLNVLETLVLVLVLRLLLKQTWLAVVISLMLFAGSSAFGTAPTLGWWVAILSAVIFIPGTIFVLMRSGLLAGTTSMFVTLMMDVAVASLDFSSWYVNRALVAIGVLVGILVYGAVTATAGKSLFGDPLRDPAAR